jgi:hypothetical protein
MIKGVLKAAGSAEGLDAELITDWTNNVSLPYTIFTKNADTRIIDSAIGAGGTAYADSNKFTVTADSLIKVAGTTTNVAGQLPNIYLHTGVEGVLMGVTTATFAFYGTLPTGYDQGLFLNTAVCSFAINPSYKKVLAPSTSGSTIVSQKGGSVWNFSYKNASFVYNEANYYCVIKALH